MPMSGNLGDTLNAMPVISGIFKSTGHKISLVVRDKMKMFNGFREFMQMQGCIAALKFESEVTLDDTYQILSLVDNFTKHENRPWETVRLEEDFKRRYSTDFYVDDRFTFVVDENIDNMPSEYIVGDRMSHPQMDQRRLSGVLKSSGKFDSCYFLDYNKPLATNAAYLRYTEKPIITTFTGISTIADLLFKETIILWGDDLKNWDNKPIEYSFNKHFYRDRHCKLVYLNDFTLNDEVINEIFARHTTDT